MFQGLLDPEVQKGTRDLRDHLVNLAKREKKEKRVFQDYEVQEESKVIQDLQVCQA